MGQKNTACGRYATVVGGQNKTAEAGLPSGWTLVGFWALPRRDSAGGDTVPFFAVDPSEAASLADHLREFSSQLPQEVIQRGSYTK